MAAQTEYKNARSLTELTARVGAISGSNQRSHAAVSGEFCDGLSERERERVAFAGGYRVLLKSVPSS